jgi:hypothetical protein
VSDGSRAGVARAEPFSQIVALIKIRSVSDGSRAGVARAEPFS